MKMKMKHCLRKPGVCACINFANAMEDVSWEAGATLIVLWTPKAFAPPVRQLSTLPSREHDMGYVLYAVLCVIRRMSCHVPCPKYETPASKKLLVSEHGPGRAHVVFRAYCGVLHYCWLMSTAVQDK